MRPTFFLHTSLRSLGLLAALVLSTCAACGSSSEPGGGSGDAGGGSTSDAGSSPAPSTGSGRACLIEMNGSPVSCREYSSAWSEAEIARDCMGAGRTRVTSCPATGVLGICKNATAGGVLPAFDIKYYAGTVMAAMANCAGFRGTWQAN
jgi:hypothetical protein